MDIHALHAKALDTAKRFKQAEADLIEIFQKIEEARVFSKLGYTSLFEYGVKALGLSEANTYAFIQVSRKSREIPALKAAIREGTLTVSKAKKIAPVMTRENQEDWISKARTLSKHELEKEVAKLNPRSVAERSKYVSDDRLEVKLGVSERLMKKLKRVQDLISQRIQKAASLEDALEELAELYLEKKDPVRKAERVRPQLGPGPEISTKRTPIPSLMRHALVLRDGARCTHTYSDGSRCEKMRWIEVHHKKPVSQGGKNSLSNLTTLCFQHHRFIHRAR